MVAILDPTGLKEQLQPGFRGPLLAPGDEGYESARAVWNGMIDRRPALVARCAGVADVLAAVVFAREHELLIAVRGGGHNVAGNAVVDDGFVIDLSDMKAVRVDPRARLARAEPGLLWGEFDHEVQAFGLATPGGIQSTTGIAGFTLGGGIGWLSRRFGLTCDNLVSADVVTADGKLVTASAEENEDLFFAVRGGGGNFGIATSFEYRLHPIERPWGGLVLHRIERAAELLAFVDEYAQAAPQDLGLIVFFVTAPAAAHVPVGLHGQPIVGVGVCYEGGDAEEVLRPLRAFGPPEADGFAPMSYLALQSQFDAANPPGQQNYWKAEYVRRFDSGACGAIAEHAARRPPGLSKVLITRLGGAIAGVPDDATAFSHRLAPWIVNLNAMWADPKDDFSGWARDFWDALQPYSAGGVYVNFLGNEGAERVRAAYGDEKYERLARLKARYDPENVFRLNQNITPLAD